MQHPNFGCPIIEIKGHEIRRQSVHCGYPGGNVDVFNSAVLLQATEGTESQIQQTVYIKPHLAPIGEYAPPGFGWIVDLLGVPMLFDRLSIHRVISRLPA